MYKNSQRAVLSICEYCPESPFSTLLLLQLDLRSTSKTATGSQNETHPSTYKSAQFIIHNRCLSSSHTDIIITTCRSVLPLHYLTLKLHFCETLTHPQPYPFVSWETAANRGDSAERIFYCYCFIIQILKREGYKMKHPLAPVIWITRTTAHSVFFSPHVFHS